MSARPAARCGTPSGANRHRRNGEPVCAACRDAKSRASLAYRKRNPSRPPADLAWVGESIPGAVVIGGGHYVKRGLVLVPVGPRPVDAPPPACGTDKGYQRHLNAGEDTCAPCREAHRIQVAERRARKREAA